MEAALFTYRFLEQPEGQFPFSAGSFIICGRGESIEQASVAKLDELAARSERPLGRIHKAGPLGIHPLIWTRSGWREIDWKELSQRVTQEEKVRPDEVSCVFSMASAGTGFSRDSKPGISENRRSEFQAIMFPQTDRISNRQPFLFMGSKYNDESSERIGTVCLIESSSIFHALEVCMDVIKGPARTATHVEWCCPISVKQ